MICVKGTQTCTYRQLVGIIPGVTLSAVTMSLLLESEQLYTKVPGSHSS